jgi:Ni/Fe-hydrogenase b-type cytochrome subunit
MPSAAVAPASPEGYLYYRHALAVRVMHWINVIAMTILLMSGLNIFDAHSALYWGKSSYTGAGPIFAIGARMNANGDAHGVTRVFGREFDTTGVLGVSKDRDGDVMGRSFPWWLTIPDNRWLSMARSWHFFFAWVLVLNGIAYVAWSIASRHLARDLAPDRTELRSIGQSIRDHLRFRHPTGEAAKRYNVLQRLAYLGVGLLIVLMVLTGLTMSPGFDAFFPWLLDLFGGRQTARSLHFISASLIVLFIVVHLVEVLLAGPINEVRSMLTGRYVVPKEHTK